MALQNCFQSTVLSTTDLCFVRHHRQCLCLHHLGQGWPIFLGLRATIIVAPRRSSFGRPFSPYKLSGSVTACSRQATVSSVV